MNQNNNEKNIYELYESLAKYDSLLIKANQKIILAEGKMRLAKQIIDRIELDDAIKRSLDNILTLEIEEK